MLPLHLHGKNSGSDSVASPRQIRQIPGAPSLGWFRDELPLSALAAAGRGGEEVGEASMLSRKVGGGWETTMQRQERYPRRAAIYEELDMGNTIGKGDSMRRCGARRCGRGIGTRCQCKSLSAEGAV